MEYLKEEFHSINPFPYRVYAHIQVKTK